MSCYGYRTEAFALPPHSLCRFAFGVGPLNFPFSRCAICLAICLYRLRFSEVEALPKRVPEVPLNFSEMFYSHSLQKNSFVLILKCKYFVSVFFLYLLVFNTDFVG